MCLVSLSLTVSPSIWHVPPQALRCGTTARSHPTRNSTRLMCAPCWRQGQCRVPSGPWHTRWGPSRARLRWPSCKQLVKSLHRYRGFDLNGGPSHKGAFKTYIRLQLCFLKHIMIRVMWLWCMTIICLHSMTVVRLFLNLRTCPYLCSCGLEKRHQSQPKYCSNSKSASSQVQSKCPDVFLLRPFYRGCIGWWLVWTWAAKYPRMHFAHQPAAPFIN